MNGIFCNILYFIGPDAHNQLRTICEQQQHELEYLRNIVVCIKFLIEFSFVYLRLF
jgi:hypothetical protein